MSYFEDINSHMNNIFENYSSIEALKTLPSKSTLKDLENNKLYKTNFVSIAVDVVNFKKLSEYSEAAALNAIMNEFTYGVVKIMKEFTSPAKIDIQGDGIYAIYRIKTKDDVDAAFSILCGLNTFQNHLQAKIEKYFDRNQIKDSLYPNSFKEMFSFGIGASYSFENFISKVGHGVDKDLIFMGHSVNCANELAKLANRNGRKPILMDDLFQLNLTKQEKNRIQDIGGVNKININSSYAENIHEFAWMLINYTHFVNNNV